jgi:prepilin-type N-terminal cleavage/methylation domain-containing protein
MRRSDGFSLIEVLVATTVLLIIVMIVAMVFEQSSGAWAAGTRRADSHMTLRGLLGTMQREMANAVDARDFGFANNFTASEADFVALSGEPPNRVPQLISYSYNNGNGKVTRSCQNLKYSGGTWQEAGSDVGAVMNPDRPLLDFEFKVTDGADQQGLPLRVDIEAHLQTKGDESLICGRSAGRDREFDTADDIYVGARER